MAINSKSGRDRSHWKVSSPRHAAGIRYLGSRSREADAEWKRQMALMPKDTRDLTGRLMGDPIPGDPRRPLAAGGEKCQLHKRGDL